MDESSLDEMIEQAATEIKGSSFAPRQVGKGFIDFINLIWGFIGGFEKTCKANNREAREKKLKAAAEKAAKGKDKIKAPKWAYEIAEQSGIKSATEQTKAIHATLLWVGTHPGRAADTIEKYRNDRERFGDAFKSPRQREETPKETVDASPPKTD